METRKTRRTFHNETNHRPITRSRGTIDSDEEDNPLDTFENKQCLTMLNLLNKIQETSIFMEPVDPEAWNIPNYFEIIKQPMDLGTVYDKLKKNMYYQIEEYRDDVRLTFTNAMTFNPPGNYVYLYAEKLLKIFNNYYRHIERQCFIHRNKKGRNYKRGPRKELTLKEIFSNKDEEIWYHDDPLEKSQMDYIVDQLKDVSEICLSDIADILEITDKQSIVNGDFSHVDLTTISNVDLRRIYDILKFVECNI